MPIDEATLKEKEADKSCINVHNPVVLIQAKHPRCHAEECQYVEVTQRFLHACNLCTLHCWRFIKQPIIQSWSGTLISRRICMIILFLVEFDNAEWVDTEWSWVAALTNDRVGETWRHGCWNLKPEDIAAGLHVSRWWESHAPPQISSIHHVRDLAFQFFSTCLNFSYYCHFPPLPSPPPPSISPTPPQQLVQLHHFHVFFGSFESWWRIHQEEFHDSCSERARNERENRKQPTWMRSKIVGF